MNCKISIIILIVLSTSLLSISCHKIYFIQNRKSLNWTAASSDCKAKGMNLVSIKTSEEQEYLKEFIKEADDLIYPYWLGAYRVNGEYEWTATGEKIKQFFWNTGAPNDKSGNEKCIHTWEENFYWFDNDCEREFPFICDLEV